MYKNYTIYMTLIGFIRLLVQSDRHHSKIINTYYIPQPADNCVSFAIDLVRHSVRLRRNPERRLALRNYGRSHRADKLCRYFPYLRLHFDDGFITI